MGEKGALPWKPYVGMRQVEVKRRLRWGGRVGGALLLVLWCLSARMGWAQEQQRMAFWVTSPWLALMTRFLGGVYVDVHPLSGWDSEGNTVRYKRPPAEARIIALDRADRQDFDLDAVPGARIRLLFNGMPYLREQGKAHFLDPATMPFLGQRILTVLAAFDAENYQYYQRRLAEFQSRLESTVGVGRQLLGSIPLLSLSSELALWLEAAGKRHITPPWDVTEAWGRGERLEVFERTLTEAQTGQLLVIFDSSLPKALQERLALFPAALRLPLPDVLQTEDLFLFLYDQYLAVWNFSRHGPEPSRSPRPRRKP